MTKTKISIRRLKDFAFTEVPGIAIDVSNKSALEEYLKKPQEQVARSVVTPIALLVDNANRLMERLSELSTRFHQASSVNL